MRASVTFETVTPESCEDSDFADHGWIAPNEYRASLGKARRAATTVEVDCRTWEPGRGWTVRVYLERERECEQDLESVGYSLFVTGLSEGSAGRLARLLEHRTA